LNALEEYEIYKAHNDTSTKPHVLNGQLQYKSNILYDTAMRINCFNQIIHKQIIRNQLNYVPSLIPSMVNYNAERRILKTLKEKLSDDQALVTESDKANYGRDKTYISSVRRVVSCNVHLLLTCSFLKQVLFMVCCRIVF
jgi:hypothetical protein